MCLKSASPYAQYEYYVCLKSAYCCVYNLICFCYTYFLSMEKSKPKRAYEAFLIGKQIRYYRRIKEMSQRQLANKVGVTVGWIGRLERGKHMPNIRLLFKISGALQVKVKDLIPF